MNKYILPGAIVLVLLLGLGGYFLTTSIKTEEPVEVPEEIVVEEVVEVPFSETKVIGNSVESRDITVTTFGNPQADNHLIFVGGIHGGYEWNSSLLAYEMISYLKSNESLVPADIFISIIPVLNPDGLATVVNKEGEFVLSEVSTPGERVASARFNANNVDLNRNFDCKWQPESTWRGNRVSAGTSAFSEPEAQALRDYVISTNPDAVVFWHSQANNVYASECENGVLPATLSLMSTYARAGSYGEVPVFDAYPVTGDAEGWLASIGIPAVTVELEGFRTTEWARNLAGTKAVIDSYSSLGY